MKKPPGEPAAAPNQALAGGVDLSVVSALAEIAARHDLSEVEVDQTD